MGDFFLLQMDDSFTRGVCFDNRKEGEGGAPTPRSPILRRSACADLAPSDKGKAKGQSPVRPRPNNTLFYFRRFLRALLALSAPLCESLVPLPFLSPDTLSLAAFVAASLTFLPIPAMLITLL